MGFRVAQDCELGLMMHHGGGYPGYGSRVLLMPDKGLGVFVLANKTYAGPTTPAFKAALALLATGAFPDRAVAVSGSVAQGYELAKTIWRSGSVSGVKPGLAMNFLMDRDEAHWTAELARLKAEVGECATTEPVSAGTAMQGSFSWSCAHGRISGSFLLAPEKVVQLQALEFSVSQP